MAAAEERKQRRAARRGKNVQTIGGKTAVDGTRTHRRGGQSTREAHGGKRNASGENEKKRADTRRQGTRPTHNNKQ